MSCSGCHTVFPELTPYGRAFKLRGYTTSSDSEDQSGGMQIDRFAPLSAMIQSSFTSVDSRQPDTQNDNLQLPSQLSLFYAGRIASKLGAFVQMTYDAVDDHFSLDNTDIRFADNAASDSGSLVYGLTLNNNPTVQDLWNSTPAWGFPYTASEIAPTPAAATQLDGPLAQEVAGLGAYTLWHDWLYGELSLYRNSQVGQNQPPDSSNENVIDGTAPYWRLAIEHAWGPHAVEVGTYGLNASVHPGAGTPLTGPTNDFRDVAFDAQYQYISSPHIVSAHSTWINEDQDWSASNSLGAAADTSSTLQTFKLDVSYFYRRKLGGTLAFFDTSGDRDALLYQPASVDGSRSGRPDSRGWIAELDYLPWLNTRFSLQYAAYNRFNGSGNDYDGFGRDASDNNTVFLSAWLVF
jgi:hypothetical protein